MLRWFGLVAFLAAITAPLFGLLGRSDAARPDQQAERLELMPRTKAQWLGAGSCASAACHNSNGLKSALGSEYTTWIFHDIHARAYEVLHNKRSHDIVEKLPLNPKTDAQGHVRKPYELGLCLNCHVHRGYDKAEAAGEHHARFSKEDGVSCESCHGPAGSWIDGHYRTGWDRKGMWPTRSLVERVQSCTPCHVGAKDMEVDHDLIAAGHPRLAFEFSAYHALMPHHWQDVKDWTPGASERAREDWDAKAWFVGQVATTEAALELLAHRRVWPEFAEYDCYACHHQIEGQSWRQDPSLLKGRKPGTLRWNDWYASPLPHLLAPESGALADLPRELAELKTLLESQASFNEETVRKLAAAAAMSMAGVADQFKRHEFTSKDLEIALIRLVDRGEKKPSGSWDEAAQSYLAVVALHEAWGRQKNAHARPPLLQPTLIQLRSLLRFQDGVDSPRAEYTPVELLKHYGELKRQLGSKNDKRFPSPERKQGYWTAILLAAPERRPDL